jgi:multidrug efflux system outer membrane protein
LSVAVRRPCAALAIAALVAGCAIGPNYKRPELPEPSVFRDAAAEEESIADTPWFDVFRDEALVALVKEALANNRDLLAATERVETSRALAAVQRGELFPTTSYEVDASRGNDTTLGLSTPGRGGTQNDYLAALSAAWEIDVWGRLRRASESARAEMLATEAFRRGVVLSLVTGVAQAYFELRELDLELEIANSNVGVFTETRDLFQRQYLGGVASKLDYLRGEAALAQVAAVVPALEQQIVAKENQISVLIGRPAGSIPRGTALVDQELPPAVPPGIPSQLLERRPDLIEAEQTAIAANARIGVALGNFLPRIGLTSVLGSASGDLASLLASGTGYWALLGQGFGPIFTFGRNWYGWRASQHDSEATRYAYEQTVLLALQDTSDALIAREKLAGVRSEEEQAVAALAEALRIARVRYVGGLATYLEVLDAQQQLFPAELDLARTRRDEWTALIALYRALGGGWNQYPPYPSVPQPIAP